MLFTLLVVAVGLTAFLLASFALEGTAGKSSGQLIAMQADRVKAAGAIQDKATAEQRELNADEIAQIKTALDEAEQLGALAAQVQSAEQLQQRLAQARESLAKPKPRPSMATTTASTSQTLDVELMPTDRPVTSGMRDRAQDDLSRGFRGYEDFAAMVAHCSRFGGLAGPWANRPEVSAAYGQNTFNGDEGGFMIPPEYDRQMFTRAVNGAPLRAAVFGAMIKRQLAGNSIEFVAAIDHDKSSTTYRNGGIIVYLVDEGAQITRSTMKIRKLSLKLVKLGAMSFATAEDLADGGISGNDLLNKHADAMGDQWLEYALWGTGAGQPLGIFAAANPAVITTSKVAGQLADSLDLSNVLDMQDDLWTGADAGAIWLANRECRKGLRLLKQDIGTGGAPVPLFERGRAGGAADMLDGRDLWFTDHMPALGDLGDMGLADFGQYVWATKRGGGIETASSIHLRFDYEETAFRSTWRADGRPIWDRAETPRKGASGATVSPYVKLEARA